MSTIGFSKLIKKFDILFVEKKPRMLGQIMCQPTLPCSLNFKFGYFCMQLFFPRGALNSAMLILMNLIWFHYLLVLFKFFVKVPPRAGVLTSSVVLLFGLSSLLIA